MLLCPTDIPSLLPIEEFQNDPLRRRTRRYLHPTDIRSRVPIAKHPDDPNERLQHRSVYPTDIRSRVPIAKHPNDPHWRPKNKSAHPTSTRQPHELVLDLPDRPSPPQQHTIFRRRFFPWILVAAAVEIQVIIF